VNLLNSAANRSPVRHLLCAICLSGVILAGSLAAQESVAGQPLTLEGAIDEALTRNLGLRIERLETVVSSAAVEEADAAFDTTLTASARLGERDVDSQVTRSDNRSYTAGARKRIRLTNAAVQVQTRLNRIAGSSYDSEFGGVVGGTLRETADFTVAVTQPLMRGFGRDIAEAPLESARAGDRATQLQLRDTALALIENTETAYWELATAEARLEVRQSNRRLAESLLEEMRERENLGLATRLDVIQAEANLAQREDDILVAEQGVREAVDALLVYLGRLDAGSSLDATAIAVEALPSPPTQLPTLNEVWQSALFSDPMIAAQAERITQQSINRRLAADERRPQLDLTLSGGFSGLSDEDAVEAYELAGQRDGTEWGVQFQFSIPLGQRAARASLRSADARMAQAEWTLAQMKQNLLREVRTAHREFETRQKRLRSAELVLRLQEETFEQERTKLDEGLSTLRDVLEIQADLDDARLALLDARAATILAELRMERLRGTLLERHGLTWPQVQIP